MHLNTTSEIQIMNFVDTDLICLITAQMSYSNWLIKCKNLTQMIMHTLKKKKKYYKRYKSI